MQMIEDTVLLNRRNLTNDFQIVQGKISIFPDAISRDVFEGVEDNQKVVFVTIGPGETRVNVLDDEGRSINAWIAVFGWSSLCGIQINHREKSLYASNIGMITKALRGSLRLYGEAVETSGFLNTARGHFHSGLSYILDQTIGGASEYDRIVLASPEWFQEVLKESINLRPHIDPVIQDL